MNPPDYSSLTPTIIEPAEGWLPLKLGEIWRFRELAFFLAWRDISVRYKQTVLGVLWAIIQPFSSMVIFSIVFGQFAHISSEGIPYPLFSFAVLLPWQYFATALTEASQSLINNERLITKVYFPRLIIPLASILPALVDFVIAFLVFLGMLLYYTLTSAYHVTITINLLWTPVFLLLALSTALGAGLWIAALNVQYRDFRYVVPFLVQAWMYASPEIYPLSNEPQTWQTLYGLNPVILAIQGFPLI